MVPSYAAVVIRRYMREDSDTVCQFVHFVTATKNMRTLPGFDSVTKYDDDSRHTAKGTQVGSSTCQQVLILGWQFHPKYFFVMDRFAYFVLPKEAINQSTNQAVLDSWLFLVLFFLMVRVRYPHPQEIKV